MKKKIIIGIVGLVTLVILNYLRPSSQNELTNSTDSFKTNTIKSNQMENNNLNSKNSKTVTIGFYNVENLFDIYDDPNTFDEDFTPDGEKRWDRTKYQDKLTDISEVIKGIGKSNDLPALVGLAEIENYDVLKDLISTKNLRNKSYKIIHGNNNDSRGIDVAAIYRSDIFEKIDYTYYKVPDLHTRDILHIEGKLYNQDVIHYFVIHWPSRRKGTAESEYKRIEVADILRDKIDLVKQQDASAKILIMGDFNDEPSNKSVKNNLLKDDLTNLFEKSYLGTVNHRGEWLLFDQIIVSNSLLNADSYSISEKDAKIYNAPEVTFTHRDGNTTPSRTYGGTKYYGGTSDHYAVYCRMKVRF